MPLASMGPLLVPVRGTDGPARASLLDLPNVQLVGQGRSAMALALLESGVGSADSVLLPAYNCPSMTAAIRATGASCRFFRIGADLGIDLRDVVAAIDGSTRAVVIPHLFMHRQREELFRYLEGNTNLTIIEDCAHAFFPAGNDANFGTSAHYVVGSISKFFPTRWGGVIAGHARKSVPSLERPALSQQFKRAFNSLEETVQYAEKGALRTVVATAVAVASAVRTKVVPRTPETAPAQQPLVSDGIDTVDAATLREAAGPWVHLHTRRRRTFHARAEGRERSFRELRRALEGLKSGHVLERAMSEPDFPPYVLPLILHNPQRDFPLLRQAGVPMYRWEYSARGTCAVTDHYADSLVQLPSHESLSPRAIRAIAGAVWRILG